MEHKLRVAVVGGGPAGCFFALYLLKFAKERKITPEITVYEPRDFDELGPKACKGCAGILSMSLVQNLEDLGLSLPEGVIQCRLERYTVHSPYTSITLTKPEKGMQIISIYRGGGPRLSHGEQTTGFDAWLVKQAGIQGAIFETKRVDSIHLAEEAGIEVGGKKEGYDLVVLASGVNSAPVKIIGLEYVPPKTQIMAQDELYADTREVEKRLGDTAHAFLMPRSGLIFGTLVPKGPFINVSVLSRGERPISVNDFLQYDIVRAMLPERYEHACGCRPKAAISSARHYFSNRFVVVGDAAVSRLYKDGIGSSLLTAREAARTVAEHGVRAEDFARYYLPFCRNFDRDNRWGQRLFSINDLAKNSRLFLFAQHRLIGNEQNNAKSPQPFTKAAWGMFTGSYTYRNIAGMTLNPISVARFAGSLLQEGLRNAFQRQVSGPKVLHVGARRVLILGSGFGGTYVLRHLVPALNKNENVETTMVSDENFFLFAPLLHEVAAGRIETRHIAYPIRRLHWRDRFNFVQASVRQIDLDSRRVTTTKGSFEFDYLVLALGSVADTSVLDRINQGGRVFGLKTLNDARLMRNHIIELFEQTGASEAPEAEKGRLTFVVCGGGYTGVQIITELRDFVFHSLFRFYRIKKTSSVRMVLVEAHSKVAADLHTKLGAYVMKHLKRTGIEVRLNSKVTRIQEGSVIINNKQVLPTDTVIWVTGNVAHPLIAGLPVDMDKIGRVLVNQYMEIPQIPGIYALGDCAHFKDPKSGQPIPPRAHMTVRQARIVAHNILAEIRGRDKKPYRYSNYAEAVSLGSTDATVRFYNLRLYGFLARLVWLAGYSSLVTGMSNRIKIIMDWLLSFIFGRDVTFLKLTK